MPPLERTNSSNPVRKVKPENKTLKISEELPVFGTGAFAAIPLGFTEEEELAPGDIETLGVNVSKFTGGDIVMFGSIPEGLAGVISVGEGVGEGICVCR